MAGHDLNVGHTALLILNSPVSEEEEVDALPHLGDPLQGEEFFSIAILGRFFQLFQAD
jgi:hypothetical protein